MVLIYSKQSKESKKVRLICVQAWHKHALLLLYIMYMLFLCIKGLDLMCNSNNNRVLWQQLI